LAPQNDLVSVARCFTLIWPRMACHPM
jgi:hypothetical protein